MIFTDEKDPSQIYDLDIESGKIVESYTASNNKDLAALRHITNSSKNAQINQEKTLVGVSQKAVFTLDPRVNSKVKAV